MARRGAILLGALCAALLGTAVGVPAAQARADAFPPEDPALRALWQEGLALERRELLRESSQRYEALAEALPDSSFIRWRLARNAWREGERLPVDEKAERLRRFERAEQWADEALRIDPKCGECVLWKVAALGRKATTQGVIQAAGSASTIAELIDYGISLAPRYADDDRNSSLANLYYAGAAFYRVVPDWGWLRFVIGVHGDKHRALDYIQKAIALSGERVDYQVELGAVLLCIGTDEHDAARIEQGRAVLGQALEIGDYQSTDAFDRDHARILMDHPERACGYSRDGWIDLADALRKRRTATAPAAVGAARVR